jgi:hypothetical protein
MITQSPTSIDRRPSAEIRSRSVLSQATRITNSNLESEYLGRRRAKWPNRGEATGFVIAFAACAPFIGESRSQLLCGDLLGSWLRLAQMLEYHKRRWHCRRVPFKTNPRRGA